MSDDRVTPVIERMAKEYGPKVIALWERVRAAVNNGSELVTVKAMPAYENEIVGYDCPECGGRVDDMYSLMVMNDQGAPCPHCGAEVVPAGFVLSDEAVAEEVEMYRQGKIKLFEDMSRQAQALFAETDIVGAAKAAQVERDLAAMKAERDRLVELLREAAPYLIGLKQRRDAELRAELAALGSYEKIMAVLADIPEEKEHKNA